MLRHSPTSGPAGTTDSRHQLRPSPSRRTSFRNLFSLRPYSIVTAPPRPPTSNTTSTAGITSHQSLQPPRTRRGSFRNLFSSTHSDIGPTITNPSSHTIAAEQARQSGQATTLRRTAEAGHVRRISQRSWNNLTSNIPASLVEFLNITDDHINIHPLPYKAPQCGVDSGFPGYYRFFSPPTPTGDAEFDMIDTSPVGDCVPPAFFAGQAGSLPDQPYPSNFSTSPITDPHHHLRRVRACPSLVSEASSTIATNDGPTATGKPHAFLRRRAGMVGLRGRETTTSEAPSVRSYQVNSTGPQLLPPSCLPYEHPPVHRIGSRPDYPCLNTNSISAIRNPSVNQSLGDVFMNLSGYPSSHPSANCHTATKNTSQRGSAGPNSIERGRTRFRSVISPEGGGGAPAAIAPGRGLRRDRNVRVTRGNHGAIGSVW